MRLPKLIALDLDGTLLPESKVIGERTFRVLNELAEAGVRITLASGKFLHLTRHYGEALGIETPIIALDGARVCDNGRVEETGLDLEEARVLWEELLEDDWHAFGDSGTDDLLLRSNSDLLARITSVWADRILRVDEVEPHLSGSPGLLVAYGPTAKVEERAARVRERHPDLRVSLFESPMMSGTRLTIQPPATSKGTALERLLNDLDIEVEDAMVFGDWMNDIPMFDIGCVNVAMANAVPELLSRADYVTRYTSEDEGVAEFLERSLLGS